MSKTEKNTQHNLHDNIIGRFFDILSPVIGIFNLVISIITLYLLVSSFSILQNQNKEEISNKTDMEYNKPTMLIPYSSSSNVSSVSSEIAN